MAQPIIMTRKERMLFLLFTIGCMLFLPVDNSFAQTVSFGHATSYTVGGGNPRFVAIGDFNGDGKLDLAVATISTNDISILLGTTTGFFGAATHFAVGAAPVSVAIGDFNGDGKLDLAVANLYSDNVSILLGTGTGSFGTATNFAVGSFPASVGIGDFNGDGKLDLAVGNDGGNDTVSILLGDGTGAFGTATNFVVGINPGSVTIGDLNGDGKLDLAVAYSSVAIGDLNRDGKLDLAVNGGGVYILLGTGTGSFGPATNFATGTDPDSVSILLGTGSGSFGPATDFAVGSGPRSVAIGDLNGDGKPDLAVVNQTSNTVSVLLGTGTGSFGAAMNLAAGTDPVSVTVGDLNGDGKPDLAVADLQGGTVSILLNTSLPKLVNISTRALVQTGDKVMIGGFIIGGNAPKTVLIRVRGPSLTENGVSGAMANPYVELYTGQTKIAQNDNWQTTDPLCGSPAVSCGNAQDIQATGKDPCSVATTGCTLESAILITLPPGPYTAIVRGVGGGTGVGNVGVFDLSP